MLRSLFVLLSFAVVARAQTLTYSTVASNAYAAGDINSCAIALNNITTAGGYQFIGYYDTSRNLMLGRRTVGTSNWQTYNSGITISAAEIANDHNIIALAIDANGKMHLTWNMHNRPLNYSISNLSVTTPTLSSIPLTKQTATIAPTLFPSGGATTNLVTYPIFMPIPGSSNLLFSYRNGGSGGGSGNGNQYFNIYTPSTNTWTNQLVINGQATSVNAYLNSPVYTSTGNLLMSWTWRATPSWQTNSNIMFAQSPDNGQTWFRQGGSVPYTLPIIQSGTPASSVAQVIKAIPQNSSFINQTSMTVDQNDNPIIATWYAPAAGNFNRQYMLEYYTGTQWRTSQISNRTTDAAIDTSAAFVRDMGRPIVLVDNANRVLVVTRSQDTSMGAFSNPATVGNTIRIYWTDNLASGTPMWQSIQLDGANMGAWEPTYDSALWKSQNKLALVYEPVGLTGQTTATLRVLEWDATAYFAAIPEPGLLLLVPAIVMFRRMRRLV